MKGKQYIEDSRKWNAYLQDAFDSYFEFEVLSIMYQLHEHLGYESPMMAWEANPFIQGSDVKDDFKRIDEPA